MMRKDQQEKFYDQIMKLYDLAEDVIDAVEAPCVRNIASQADIAAPVIEQVEESTNTLGETYLRYVENGSKADGRDARKVESAVRKVFASISTFNQQLRKLARNERPEQPGSAQGKDGDPQKVAEVLAMVEAGQPIEQVLEQLKEHLPESVIQESLRTQARRLGKELGALLAKAVKSLGDHMLTLMHMFQYQGLGAVVKAVPNRARVEIGITSRLTQAAQGYLMPNR